MNPNLISESNQTAKTADTNETNNTYRTYGQYHGRPTPGQLQAYFTLEPRDRKLIRSCRTNSTRLGVM